jgi:hypothetical protein
MADTFLKSRDAVDAARDSEALVEALKSSSVMLEHLDEALDTFELVAAAAAPIFQEQMSLPEDGAASQPGDGAMSLPEDGAAGQPGDGAMSLPEDGAAGQPGDGAMSLPEDGAAGTPDE